MADATEDRRLAALGVGDWMRSYRGRRTYAYAAWDDPGPIMMSIRRVLRTGMRRFTRNKKTPTGATSKGKRPTNWFDLAAGARNG